MRRPARQACLEAAGSPEGGRLARLALRRRPRAAYSLNRLPVPLVLAGAGPDAGLGRLLVGAEPLGLGAAGWGCGLGPSAWLLGRAAERFKI